MDTHKLLNPLPMFFRISEAWSKNIGYVPFNPLKQCFCHLKVVFKLLCWTDIR